MAQTKRPETSTEKFTYQDGGNKSFQLQFSLTTIHRKGIIIKIPDPGVFLKHPPKPQR